MPLNRKLQELVEALAVLHDPQERLTAIVDRVRRMPALPPHERTEAHRVRACVSVVWLVPELRDGCCYFRSDAESPIVRGLVAFVCDFFSGFPPTAIVASEADPLETLGIYKHLSPTRRNGLAATRAAIRTFAARHAQEPN